MDPISIAIFIFILLFSIIFHEIAHGLMAERLGDTTARDAGRLTLNPVPHIDLFGSILLPAFLLLVNSPILFGAAKPVPVNFMNLRNPKRDMALVSLAGPGSNFILALACSIPLRFGLIDLNTAGGAFLLQVVVLNLVLAIFNLIPIPPLDGSKILASVLADRYLPMFFALERYGFLLIILFLFTGLFSAVLLPALNFFLTLLIGVPLF